MKKMVYDLDQFIDVSILESHHLETCAGIAQSKTFMSSRVIPHFEMQNNIPELIKFKKQEGYRVAQIFDEGARHLNFEEKRVFAKLTHEQKKRFLQLYKKAYWDGEYVRVAYPRKEFWTEHDSIFYSDKCEWQENAQHFPGLKKFIASLPFIDIGRVAFFITYHYLHSDVHYDRENNVYDGSHHYIWINPFKNKRFFLLDDDGQKTYVNSKVAIFDGMKLHGSEPADQMTYTLRVDGQLSEEFCQKVGLPWKQRNGSKN